jgi:hypothetical protein
MKFYAMNNRTGKNVKSATWSKVLPGTTKGK